MLLRFQNKNDILTLFAKMIVLLVGFLFSVHLRAESSDDLMVRLQEIFKKQSKLSSQLNYNQLLPQYQNSKAQLTAIIQKDLEQLSKSQLLDASLEVNTNMGLSDATQQYFKMWAALINGQINLNIDDEILKNSHQFYVRKVIANHIENHSQDYTSLGQLGNIILISNLDSLIATYTLLKDYGITTIHFNVGLDQKANVEVDCGDSLTIQMNYEVVVPDSQGYEVLNFASAAKGMRSQATNWWVYRDIDHHIDTIMEKNILPQFRWRACTQAHFIDQEGHTIATQMSPGMAIFPTQNPYVKNYYFRVTTPTAAQVEASLQECRRIKYDYPYSPLLDDALLFEQYMNHLVK